MLALAGTLCSCNDYLDKEPLSDITPEAFFTDDSQLAAYVNNYYASILPSHGNWSYGLCFPPPLFQVIGNPLPPQ